MPILDTIRANLMTILAAVGGAVALGLLIALLVVTGQRNAARKGWEAEKAAYAGTVANYRAATEKARADDLAKVREAEALNARLNKEKNDEIAAMRRDADSRYERLRTQAAAYSRLPSGKDMPETRDATCLAYAAARCDELPAKMKAAQDNTDQLVSLQSWVAQTVN